MANFSASLDWIHSQAPTMLSTLESWVNINSGSENLAGLALMLRTLNRDFELLGGIQTEITLPPLLSIDDKGDLVENPLGKVLHIVKHPQAPIRIFLGGHMDTVYPITTSFLRAERVNETIMTGPGIADMKGGLLIMLKSLEALERSPLAGRIGWEILINPDEEIGSVGSELFLKECAHRNQLGLLFEPAMPDGSFVSARNGTATFTVIARGRSAHVGRDFKQGRNAIQALARFILEAQELNEASRGLIVNVGRITGGGPANVVPDLAICRINVRATNTKDLLFLEESLQQLLIPGEDGISFQFHRQTLKPPKEFDPQTETLFALFKDAAKELGLEIQWKPSGGACDGNILAAEGLKVIDTLGAVGGKIHTHEEFIHLPSLCERTALTTLFLMRLANREINP